MLSQSLSFTCKQIEARLDQIEALIKEIVIEYGDHAQQLQFRHLLAFNCLWPWYHRYNRPYGDIDTAQSFHDVRAINTVLSQTNSSTSSYKNSFEMGDKNNPGIVIAAEAVSSQPASAIGKLSEIMLRRRVGPNAYAARQLNQVSAIPEVDTAITHHNKVQELFTLAFGLPVFFKETVIPESLELRLKKLPLLCALLKFNLFNPENVRRLFEYPLQSINALDEKIRHFFATAHTAADVSKIIMTFLVFPKNIKNIGTALAFIIQNNLSKQTYLDSIVNFTDAQAEMLTHLRFYPDCDSPSSPDEYEKVKIAASLLEGVMAKQAIPVLTECDNNSSLAHLVDSRIELVVKVTDLKEALNFNDEMQAIFLEASAKVKNNCFENLRLIISNQTNLQVTLIDKDAIDLTQILAEIVAPVATPTTCDALFALKKRVRAAKISERILGKKRADYLQQYPENAAEVLLFDVELLPFNNLGKVYDVKSVTDRHISTLHHWQFSVDELKWLKPFIDKDDMQSLRSAACGLRWLAAFNLRNEARLEFLKASPLGFRILNQIGFYFGYDNISFETTRALAAIIFDCLLPLMQSKLVQDHFADFARLDDLRLHDANLDAAIWKKPDTHHEFKMSLPAGDVLLIKPIIECDELRAKTIAILGHNERSVKYILPESKHHADLLHAFQYRNSLITVATYGLEQVFHQYIVFGGPTYSYKAKVWDLESQTCIKEIIEDRFPLVYRVLSPNRIAYLEGNQLVIYDLNKRAIEMQWSLKFSHHFHSSPVEIRGECEKGLVISLQGQEKTLLYPLSRLTQIVNYYSSLATRVTHGMFSGHLPRQLREINIILDSLIEKERPSAIQLTTIIKLAEQIGVQHPIVKAAQACTDSCSKARSLKLT